ncbi:hypothetical protein PUNSTDRAFT_111715 [Punctularia strigosozonata HHB-11173 SS5]|uniref:uncharacterized protein n=1 Tax=Punctularia strigosozonata (strain HHB-11173) TaxID=741275 RepID=UPI00044180ED|nr:uncharacterized protein PUNSTDRAFT_111715 [Punctularia strigosozonata HHB-11173 SS5]EIN11635.1 hypothetical protein PUNSTDRAFT_111715 [Punctularia strigosozonata HHB-11173 SS5]
MFYSDAILSKRGPLAKVWLAAHMERKLSKAQTLQTDIEQSVDAIMGQEIEVMALRLSGQLLLGVVRIYSRKAKYLLDDCNEALLKIKMAFRPGVVDMTDREMEVNKNAITLQGDGFDIDLVLPDLNWDLDLDEQFAPKPTNQQHVARKADITLASADDLQFEFSDGGLGFDLGPSDGIGSNDFEVDLGISFEDDEERRSEDADSIEVGRDAAVGRGPRESFGSELLGKPDVDMDDLMSNRSRAPSEHPFGNDFGDFGFAPGEQMDLDLGLTFDEEQPGTPGQTRSPLSPLSEPPATPPPHEAEPDVLLTPRATAVADGEAAAEEVATKQRKIKEKKQIIDSVTELADGPGPKTGRGRGGLGPVNKDISDILAEPQFLPRSAIVMRLMEIREDPLAHFMPTRTTAEGTFFCGAPPGLAPELAELFMEPVGFPAGKKRAASPGKDKGKKKAKLDEGSGLEDEDEIEQARRASVAPSMGLGSIIGRGSVAPEDITFGGVDDTGMAIDDFQLDIPPADQDLGRGSVAPSERSRMSRLSTPALFDDAEPSYADASCPIASFDSRPSQQSQQTSSELDRDAEVVDEGKGYSRNTVKALGLIRRELRPTAEDEEADKVLSFEQLSHKASRRAASSFFFELLVLATRDCVKVTQDEPFANIEVRAKDKLWERQRHGSVAPSIASAMGL